MKLTKIERLILANQYRILEKLYPEEARDSREAFEILQSGYTLEYDSLPPHLDSEVSEETCREVKDVLDMYRMLKNAIRDLPPGGVAPSDDAEFQGFDGNEETEHYSYALFLIETQGKWAESKNAELNSHTPMLERYRSMLGRWKHRNDRFNLTAEDVAHILGNE